MRKRLRVLLIVLVVLIVVSELLLPWGIGSLIARGLSTAAGSQDISVKVVKRPAVGMLGGQFDRVFMHALNTRVDKLTFNELDVALENVKLDMGALLSQRALAVKSAQNVDLTAVITEEELARYLNQSVKGVKNAAVAVDGGKVRITSNYALGSFASVAITLDGKIVGTGQKLKFVTERFLLNNTAVGNIGGSLLAEITLADLKKLPFGVNVRSVSMEQGKVTVYADNRTQ